MQQIIRASIGPLALLFTIGASGQAGVLDPTFDLDGITTINAVGASDQPFDMVVQPDGKAVIVGTSFGGGQYAFLLRLNNNGSLDNSFDGDGKVIPNFSAGDQGYAVLLQPDGRIVLIGAVPNMLGGTDILLARFNSDGSADATFGGGDGWVAGSVGATVQSGTAGALQPDGKILVAGSSEGSIFLARYEADGEVDTGFGTGGWTATTIGSYSEASGCALQADGSVVVCGYAITTSEDMVAVRTDANGTLDPGFDGDGTVVIPLSADQDLAIDAIVQPDGRILISGHTLLNGDYEFALVRLNTDGSLDSTFDGDGIRTTVVGLGNALGQRIALQPDGKIVQVGMANGPLGQPDIGLVRCDATGALDPAFGTSGTVTTEVSGAFDFGYAIALAPDGKILVAGESAAGDVDVAVLRYTNDTALSVPNASIAGSPVSIFPNPAAERVVVEFSLPAASVVSGELRDAAGRVVMVVMDSQRMSAGTQQVRLELGALAAGSYTLVLRGDGWTANARIVKQ